MTLPQDEGELHDVASLKDKIYLFFEHGCIRVFDRKTGKNINSRPPSDINIRHNTSLVKITDGSIYQLRNGYKGGCLLHYDPTTLDCTQHSICSQHPDAKPKRLSIYKLCKRDMDLYTMQRLFKLQ